jgi:hypothetical protein
LWSGDIPDSVEVLQFSVPSDGGCGCTLRFGRDSRVAAITACGSPRRSFLQVPERTLKIPRRKQEFEGQDAPSQKKKRFCAFDCWESGTNSSSE